MPKPTSLSVLPAKTSTEVIASSSPTKITPRHFTTAEKLRIVEAANACTQRGEVGALLRREGISSSLLASWRKELRLRGAAGLEPRPQGRPSTSDPQAERIAELERKNAQLQKKLELAQDLLALQKKASELLGLTLPTDETP